MKLDLAKYFLPEGILDYFDIINDKLHNNRVHFYLEEKNTLPKEYQNEIAHSKGFSPEITVEDFPLRGKSVLLNIKRRLDTFKYRQDCKKRLEISRKRHSYQ